MMTTFKISKLNPWQQKMRPFLIEYYGYICDQLEDDDEFWFFIDGFEEDFTKLNSEQDCLKFYYKLEDNALKIKNYPITTQEAIEFVEIFNERMKELKELLKK